MDDSLFLNSLKLILDESNQFSVLMNESYYITEGAFSDFLNKVNLKKIFTFIFNKFSQIVEKIYNVFKIQYATFGAKTLIIKKYRRVLENADWDIDYPEERSIYTNLDNSTNINLYNMSLNKEYNGFLEIMNKISNTKKLETLYSTILSLKNSILPIDQFLDQKRGEALGKYSISKEDFGKELFLYFRSENTTPAGTISADEIKALTNEYFESRKIEDSIIRDKKSLIDASNSTLKKIDSINFDSFNFPDNVNKDVYEIFVEIVKDYCNRVQGICNIYTQLFTMKLDMFKLYKKEQTRVLGKIILESMEEGEI